MELITDLTLATIPQITASKVNLGEKLKDKDRGIGKTEQ